MVDGCKLQMLEPTLIIFILKMKKLLHLSLFILHFQIILHSSMSGVEALDANPNKQALLSFKSTVSDPQNALSGWNFTSSHCTWFGVTCTRNRTTVQSLHMPGLGLSGIIPPHLFNLTSLQVLDLIVIISERSI